MSIDFRIDTDRCIKCRLCAKECPVRIIDDITEFPEIKQGKEGICIKCQHCLAVCPTAALSIWGKNPDDAEPTMKEPVSIEGLSNLMKTRRSIRSFKDKSVDVELIKGIADTAMYAPTGHNSDSVELIFIDTAEKMEEFRELVYDTLYEIEDMPEKYKAFATYAKLWKTKKIDIIFRNAPHLVIAIAPNRIHYPDIDATVTLTYFDLLANAQGIGTLWDGMLQWTMEYIAPVLKAKVGIPEDYKMVMGMLYGYSSVKYPRSIVR